MAEKIRFTISVDAEVHAAFAEMAEVSGQSLSSTVGGWLGDTTEAARFVSGKMRELRMAPSAALLELAQVQEKAANQTRALSAKWTAQELAAAGGGGRGTRSTASAAGRPPSSPTGVKESARKGRNP